MREKIIIIIIILINTIKLSSNNCSIIELDNKLIVCILHKDYQIITEFGLKNDTSK